MARTVVPLLALGLLVVGANAFSPFAGVEELKPSRLEDFCGQPEDEAGLRWCQRSVRKKLEDGGDVSLSWRMRVNPDNILSLDTEAERGVRLIRCSRRELELQLPEPYMRFAQPGKLIVASRFAHSCGERHLYHRVVEVMGQKPGPDASRQVQLSTQELPNFAHAVPSLSFSFSYIPVEANDIQTHPEMRTDYGLNRKYLERKRRLFSLNPFKMMKTLKKMKGVEQDDGGFAAGGHSSGKISTQNGILNLAPKQVSNFGWNWNFYMNTTQEPNYALTVPGAKGIVRIRKPYVKVHAGIFLNFTSEFGGLSMVPKVKWDFGMHGHGYVQGRVMCVLNTTAETEVDATNMVHLPLLNKFHKPKWFDKIEFATGHMPLSFEPGFKFNAKLYHTGQFHGAVAFGGHTHGNLNPMLSFDSEKGFDVQFQGTLYNTSIIPPLWMIFTKRFEIGVILKPLLLMRGDFAGLEKATMAIEFRPYLNLTISRDGDNTTSYRTEETKTLTVYPYRVMGLTDVQFQRKYKVKVSVLGQEIETSPEMNWGQVSFHDHVSKFSMGSTSQRSAIANPVTVTLYEVDDSSAVATEKALGTGQVRCTSLLNGVCHPSPAVAQIKQGSLDVAAVELVIMWEDSPEPWFASQIRGVGVSFPQVVLRQDALVESFPSVQSATPQGLTMHLIKDGLTYTAPIQGDVAVEGATLQGNNVIEFAPGFLQTWMPCTSGAGGKCDSPRLELYYGSKQVAVANLPQVDWTSQTAMQGTQDSFIASSNTMNVPCSVVLYAPGSSTKSIAVVTMNAVVVSPASASFVLEPTSAMKVPLTSMQQVAWTISDVDETKNYYFTLTPMKLVAVLPSQMENYVTFRRVGNQVLAPIANHSESFSMKCKQRSIGGMEASEAPCSFAHSLPVGVGFAVGDQAVVEIQWSVNGKTSELYSPPFVVEPKASARRLLAPKEDVQPSKAHELSRRLFNKAAWNNRVASHSKSCQKKNLHFNVGAGMLFRGRVDNVGVPKGFPMLGGLDEKPTISTGFRKIMSTRPGTDLRDILPAELCSGGLCSGALPGCTDVPNKTLSYPIIKFNTSRPYYYSMRKKKGKFGGLFKKVLAYAFSTLPEVVDVVVKELNTTHAKAQKKAHAMVHKVPPKHPRPAPAASASPWPAGHHQAPVPAPVPAPSTVGGQPEDAGSAFNKWWSGAARRLSGGSAREELVRERVNTDQLEHNQVIVTFRGGLPYKVNRELVERMLKNGYFMEVEDPDSEEMGPLRLTSLYEIDEGEVEGDTPEVSVGEVRLPMRTPVLVILCVSLVGAFAAAVALIVHRSDRRTLKAVLSMFTPRNSDGYSAPDEDARGLE